MTRRSLVPFKRWHFAWLYEKGLPADGMDFLPSLETMRHLEENGAWTAQVDGVPVACGGLIMQWPGRYQAWMVLNEDTGRYMRWLTRAVQARLAMTKGRVEATVRADFDKGHRWVRLLGFEVEAPLLRRYGPEGEDHVGYVRIEEEE